MSSGQPTKSKNLGTDSLWGGPLDIIIIFTAPGRQAGGPHTAGISYAKAKTMRGFPEPALEHQKTFQKVQWWVSGAGFLPCGWACWAHHSRNQPSFLFHCVLVWWWLILGMFIPNWQELCIQGQILFSSGGGWIFVGMTSFLWSTEFVFTLTWLLLWSSVP